MTKYSILPINPLYTWLERQVKMPPGLIDLKIRCHCNHNLPYPSLLFGRYFFTQNRGAWNAVDLLYTLPGIPMLFTGEEQGKSYRIDLTNVYSESNKQIIQKPPQKVVEERNE